MIIYIYVYIDCWGWPRTSTHLKPPMHEDLKSKFGSSFFLVALMYKRARLEARYAHVQSVADDPQHELRRKAGLELRQFLLDKFCTEGMPVSDVSLLSHYITQAGGLGVSDLALNPSSASKNGHRHVQKHAGKIYDDIDLVYINCPAYIKRNATRTCEKIPIYLPSQAFRDHITHDMVYCHPQKDFEKVIGGLDCYNEHPVVCRAKAECLKTKVRPLALYWDGVAYTKNDSFTAFYVTDILSNQKFLSFLLRQKLSLSSLFQEHFENSKSTATLVPEFLNDLCFYATSLRQR